MRRAGALAAALLLTSVLLPLGGCSRSGRIPEPPSGSVPVAPGAALSFHARADEFYTRLIRRRFNTLETFNDLVLRKHFRNVDAFFDYYADLAEKLSRAHFEKSRPIRVEIEEFIFEDDSKVRVQVRFVGNDRRPLRPNRTTLIRLDRWENSDGNWWVEPGKL